MKKIVSTQGLTYGEFNANSINAAISERVNNRLEYSFSPKTTMKKFIRLLTFPTM